ncbi:MAG: hypothetical protein HZB15_07470, partial [Actinobacteria bacterium]|nr:hypothetical protein [Actinomycetota bacterium]
MGSFDLSKLLGMTAEQIRFVDRQRISRRQMLGYAGGAAMTVALVACGSDDDDDSSTTAGAPGTTGA